MAKREAKGAKRITIIYDGYDAEGVYQDHERKFSENIFPDVARVDAVLAERGFDVRTVPMIRSARAFLKRLSESKPDLVFNLCEEALEDSRHEMNVCALLDIGGFRYTGSGPLTLGLSLDKALTKRLLLSKGIPTPAFFVVSGNDGVSLPEGVSYPLFVKPLKEDASLGIERDSFVENGSALAERCRHILEAYRQPALVEEYIEGRELNVSVLGNDDPFALPVSEINMDRIPGGEPRICDYRAKWAEKSDEYVNTVPVCPAPLDKDMEEKVKNIAISSYGLLGCRGYGRVDMRLSPDGVPYVLEVNPNPCLSIDAGITRSAAAAGLSYADLVCRIVDFAFDGT